MGTLALGLLGVSRVRTARLNREVGQTGGEERTVSLKFDSFDHVEAGGGWYSSLRGQSRRRASCDHGIAEASLILCYLSNIVVDMTQV